MDKSFNSKMFDMDWDFLELRCKSIGCDNPNDYVIFLDKWLTQKINEIKKTSEVIPLACEEINIDELHSLACAELIADMYILGFVDAPVPNVGTKVYNLFLARRDYLEQALLGSYNAKKKELSLDYNSKIEPYNNILNSIKSSEKAKLDKIIADAQDVYRKNVGLAQNNYDLIIAPMQKAYHDSCGSLDSDYYNSMNKIKSMFATRKLCIDGSKSKAILPCNMAVLPSDSHKIPDIKMLPDWIAQLIKQHNDSETTKERKA